MSLHLLECFFEFHGNGLFTISGGIGFFDVIQGLGRTEGHTFGFPVAKIALDNPAAGRFENHGAERTGQCAHPTADALHVVPGHTVHVRISMHGPGGTNRDTRSVLTLLASSGHGKALRLPCRHLNPGSVWTEFAVMKCRTGQGAVMTSRAAIGINHQHLRHNFLLKIKERYIWYYSDFPSIGHYREASPH